jgi:hypothetical protein
VKAAELSRAQDQLRLAEQLERGMRRDGRLGVATAAGSNENTHAEISLTRRALHDAVGKNL